jgi:hypothetical protein
MQSHSPLKSVFAGTVVAAFLAVPAIAAISFTSSPGVTEDASPVQLGGFTLILGGLSGSLGESTIWFNTYIDNTLVATASYPISNVPDTFSDTLTSSDSNFAAVVALLTNGVNDNIKDFVGLDGDFGPSSCCGPSSTEAPGFFPGGGGPDFKGDTITSVDITWYDVSVNSSFVAFDETFIVNGTTPVPEPGGLLPLGIALVATIGVRAARRDCRSPKPKAMQP